MLPNKLAFVDIETTGLRAPYDRIIEIGILRVEDNKLVQTFHSLINPQTFLPKEIEMMTGITAGDLEYAPTFNRLKDAILAILADCTFAAHNVRFDYGFIKNEFKRENISFSSKHFCTVRLSQLLFPTEQRHNLDAIMKRFAIPCETRHRALDDAQVLFEFYQKLQERFSLDELEKMVNKCLKKPSLPVHLQATDLDILPEKPGVYIFYGKEGMPLYIGKSKNIKNRVLSHFASDISSVTEMNISQQIESIETQTTAGEIGALFLESHLIKKLLPLYNKKSRIKKELVAIKSRINTTGYQECFLEPITTIDPNALDTFLGFCKSQKQAKAFLADLAKQYSLCEKLLGLEKTQGACFANRLGQCKGACLGNEKPEIYNLRSLMAFSSTKIQPWPFAGPIIIEEKELNGNQEYFAVNNWCYLGKVGIDAEGNKKSNIDQNVTFDLDLYQILKQFIKKSPLSPQIKIVSPEQLALFLQN
ncbi:MAG TPA: exonuclease domain-containing protein [Methylomirabilota bacterium]|nr:exonuclease domain-containing protein [Methylomirabilota bacterium]